MNNNQKDSKPVTLLIGLASAFTLLIIIIPIIHFGV